MVVIFRQMIDHPGPAGVEVAAAQILGGDHFTRGGLHQRRPSQKDRALITHDDGFVRHGGDISTAGGATAHDAGDLGNALGRKIGLIVEDAAEMIAVRKDFGLVGEVGTAAIHQVNAGKPVFESDFLRAQMLLD
jgi:hypothetical protein